MAKRSSSSSLLLLDTHILLWLSRDDKRLPQSCVAQIEKAAQRRELRLSVITLWEIGYLSSKGRITLAADLKTFWSETLDRLFASDLPISTDDIIQYHSLPEGFHGDPGDRFIVSQAMSRGMRLMTADSKIIAIAHELMPATILAANP